MSPILILALAIATHVDPAAEPLFRAERLEGTFVLLDVAGARLTIVNPKLAARGFIPASTFKIPNTLIGLATGVIPGERFALAWDGTRHEREAQNQDHDLASAMRVSVVWFYQEIARRIGRARMQDGVDAFAYGNRDLSGPIDRFWLDGKLRISPRQQVDFLRKLQARELPMVTDAHARILERLILLEEATTHAYHGKTGTGFEGGRAIAWLVGTTVHEGRPYVYALLVLAPRKEVSRLMDVRKRLARKLLERYGALPPAAVAQDAAVPAGG
jgi:beta-lactamase class D